MLVEFGVLFADVCEFGLIMVMYIVVCFMKLSTFYKLVEHMYFVFTKEKTYLATKALYGFL